MSSSNRVLPMPGSPLTSTMPRPVRTSSASTARSLSRPISPRGAGAGAGAATGAATGVLGASPIRSCSSLRDGRVPSSVARIRSQVSYCCNASRS
jgi:hypothetical protein